MMWLFSSVIVAILLVFGLLCLVPDEPAESAGDPLPFRNHPSVPRRKGVPVQVLFASPSQKDVLLDCIACADAHIDNGRVLHPGTPFTVRAERACSVAWADAMIDTVLTRWAENCAPVEMVVLDGPTGREVRLSDETTRVQLPIAA
jgi:hypothetical protein